MDELKMKRLILEREEKWEGWIPNIPCLEFPSDWQIKVIPPFQGMMARFWVYKGDAWVSVALDVYDRARGFIDRDQSPYWEIYPNADGDNERFHINDTTNLLAAIQKSLDS